MLHILSFLLPRLALLSHIAFVIIVLLVITRSSWRGRIINFFGKNAILFAFLLSLAAVSSSLFYSELIGYEPCVLCWWQRIGLYPLLLIFSMALWKKNHSAFLYAVPLASFAALLAVYHSYVYMGGTSILPCTALGGACAKIYVMEFGYITIPSMSLTIAVYVLSLAWAHKKYAEKNRHS